MNFYSEHIINDIVDHSELENVEEKLVQFKQDIKLVLTYLSKNAINSQYIYSLTSCNRVRYVFHSMDTAFYITSCPSMMAYLHTYRPGQNTYYILLICTKHQYKKLGYASTLLDGFIQRVKSLPSSHTKPTKIVLSSLETAVTYYEKYGFVWKPNNTLLDYPELLRYEKYEKGKEYFMMELCI